VVFLPIVQRDSLAIDWWLYRFARRKLFSELRQRAAAPLGR